MKQQHDIRVTIGIPTYNRADGYLRQALPSALAQTYAPLEIIVADNCSSDNTEAYVKSFGDRRIRYFRQPKNIDPNDNFNFCLRQARGTYFLLLHDDDLIDPTFVQACMAAADGRSDIGIIRTGTRLIDGAGNILNENPNRAQGLPLAEFFKQWLTGKTALYFCSSLFNTEGLKALGGFSSPHNLFQDVVAEFKLAAGHGRADVVDVLAGYRRHDANRGDAVRVIEWCEDCLYLLDLMCRLAPAEAAVIRRLGLAYFNRKCYRKAALIRNPLKRWAIYLELYRSFDRAVTPAWVIKHFDYARLKQAIKTVMGRPSARYV